MKLKNGFLAFKHNDRLEKLTITDLGVKHPILTVQPNRKQLLYGELLTIMLTASEEVELVDFYLDAEVDGAQTVITNGFQTWSQSREFTAQDSVLPLSYISRPLLAPYGDYRLTNTKRLPGKFHSWSWTTLNHEEYTTLMASTVEDRGYTKFTVDLNSSKVRIHRDCQGQITQSYELLQIYIGRGSQSETWTEYTSVLPKRPTPKTTGWTSWYNYYTNITQDIILDNLKALAQTKHPLDVFQIDDGWQRAIGDWGVNEKFPKGLDYLAQEIQKKGFRPGLWLAPFICERKSWIWQENYDWVLKDDKGKPVKAGWNPGWSGWFYALDFYAPGFQTYLRQVFDTVLNKWNYQLVKLDFLYAVALKPGNGRSRGQIMAEAMDFLREVCGDKSILGCGVPLAPAAGKVEYCRIGADVAPYWEDRFLKTIGYKERVSTINSLYSTLHRHMLDRRMFRNDPDVFILRDGKPKVNENKMTLNQRHTLFLLNNLLGGLIFFSDHVGDYTPEQRSQLAEMFPAVETKVQELNTDNDLYTISFTAQEREYIVLANLRDKPTQVKFPEGKWFHPKYLNPQALDLEPHQSICLVKVQQSVGPTILGSSGHLWPGTQITQFTLGQDHWKLDLHPHSAPHTKVWISVPHGTKELQVNGVDYQVETEGEISYVSVG